MKLDPCRFWVCLPFRSLRPTRSPADNTQGRRYSSRLYSAGHDWQAGETFRLLRTETVVLTFFPAAFTTGCTKEMTSFASDIEKFRGANAEVLPTSTDNSPTLKRRAEELKASYIMLSDFQRNVSAQYGVLIPDRGLANRTTFVIDKDGRIQHIDEGTAAVDISGAARPCNRLKKS